MEISKKTKTNLYWQLRDQTDQHNVYGHYPGSNDCRGCYVKLTKYFHQIAVRLGIVSGRSNGYSILNGPLPNMVWK